MISFANVFFYFFAVFLTSYSTDQIPDILVIEKDTIFIKTFPLEELGFTQRPFPQTEITLAGLRCLRGYQATWEVKGKNLFLSDLVNVHDPLTKIDIIQYFIDNEYTPTVVQGEVFADWYSKSLASYPRQYGFWGCIWKPKKARKPRASIRFDQGVMVFNKYKTKKKGP